MANNNGLIFDDSSECRVTGALELGRADSALFQIYNPRIFFPRYPDLEPEMSRHLRAELLLRKGKGMMPMKRSLCEGDS